MRKCKVRWKRTKQKTNDLVCFLCSKELGTEKFRKGMTGKLNNRLKECAMTLGDGKLLATLGGPVVVAQELKYHPLCLVTLYNRERAYINAKKYEAIIESRNKKHAYPTAFAELVTYITETSNIADGSAVFKLTELTSLYKQRLVQLGIDSPNVHSTRFKDQLLTHMPNLEAHHKGRDVLIAFKKDASSALSDACVYSDAIILAKAAKIIRKEMIDHKIKFENEFSAEHIEGSVPSSLLQFASMVEHGADIRSQLQQQVLRSDFAIAQLFQYNCYTRIGDEAKT